MSKSATSLATVGVLCGLCAVAGWASYSVAVRIGLASGFSPVELGALRYVVPGFLFAPLLSRELWPQLRAIGFKRLTILTLLAGPLYGILVMEGLKLAPLSHAVVLGPGLLLATTIFLNSLTGGTRPALYQMVGAMVLLSGVALMSSQKTTGLNHDRSLMGDEMFAASGVAMGGFTYLLRRWSLQPVQALAGMSLLSLAVMMPFLPFLFGNPFERHGGGPFLLQVLMQGAIGGLAAMLAYIAAVQRLGSIRAAYFPGFVQGVTVLIVSAIGLEPLTVTITLGVALATVGLIIAQVSPSKDYASGLGRRS